MIRMSSRLVHASDDLPRQAGRVIAGSDYPAYVCS
jgi:hypothetical protein